MTHILDKNKQYVFKINDYFDVVYFNGFIVKSKRYDFSIGQVIYSENEELIELLKSYNFKGGVLFDLFSPNGFYAENRFFQFDFDGNKFNKNGIMIIIPENEERKLQDEYYRSEHIDLRETILAKVEINEFKNLKYND